MHNTFLLSKVSNSLKEICSKNKIKSIEHFVIVVNHDSHINEDGLREHLKLHNKDIISDNTKIEIQREDIEGLTAIIKIIQSETLEP